MAKEHAAAKRKRQQGKEDNSVQEKDRTSNAPATNSHNSEESDIDNDSFNQSDLELEIDSEGSDESSENENSDAENDSFNESDMQSEADDDDDDLMDLDKRGGAKSKKNTPQAFSEAMNKILASNLKGSDKKQPILARSKGIERKIEDERLEHKARKVLSAERKALKAKGRVIPDYTTFEYEKQLRKVATRGVVKLFNAIRTQQKMTEVAVSKAADQNKSSTAIEKAKNVSTMSKSSFLDLLKSGGSKQ